MKTEFKLAIGGTILMAIISCAVSYGTLHELAVTHRIVTAFLFPIMIDGTMALAMFIRVYFAKIGKISKSPAMILAFFTLTSIILNAIGAKELIEWYIYAIAPIAVFACTELCAIIVETSPLPISVSSTEIQKPKKMRLPNGRFAPKEIIEEQK